jgi:hypothetical protein
MSNFMGFVLHLHMHSKFIKTIFVCLLLNLPASLSKEKAA